MYAVVTRGTLLDPSRRDEVHEVIRNTRIPDLRQAPGFVAAYFLWLEDDQSGLSIRIFQDEATARAWEDQIKNAPGIDYVRSDGVEVREVVASA